MFQTVSSPIPVTIRREYITGNAKINQRDLINPIYNPRFATVNNDKCKARYESLAEEEYEKLANENKGKKQNDFENESFEQQSEFWKNASVSLDQSDFEKLVEEEQCLEESSCEDAMFKCT